MANRMNDYLALQELARALLIMDREPVGITRFGRVDDMAKRPDDGIAPPRSALYFCSAVALASKRRAFVLHSDHVRCGAARRVLGYDRGEATDELVCEYTSYGVYENEDIARSVIATKTAKIDAETYGPTQALVVAPLSRLFKNAIMPDAAIFVVTAHAAMRLIQGYAFSHGSLNSVCLAGMHGMCSESFARAYVTKAVSLSLLCSGARHFGMFDERELAVTFPGEVLEAVLQGVVSTTDACEDDARKEKIAGRLAASGIDFDLTRRGSYVYRR